MMPTAKAAKSSNDDSAAKADAEQLLSDAQEQAAAVLADALGEPVGTGETDEYRVVNCGTSYSLPGVATSRRFALKGDVIELEPAEAERLRGLGAVVGRDEPDPRAPELPEGENPAGGKELESKEDHAAKVKAAKGK
jgi:hypothetical protein